jgi:Phage integrase central domain
LLARGIDPSLHSRLAKDARTGQAEDAFEVIAKEWLAKFIDPKSTSHSKCVHARFENDVFPWIGKRPIGEIAPKEMLAVIQRIEERGAIYTARRTLGITWTLRLSTDTIAFSRCRLDEVLLLFQMANTLIAR